jgi:serine/threonine protein kinase/tetratricopeptide (TPR) repeat protein
MTDPAPLDPTHVSPEETFRRLLAACIEAVGARGSEALEPLLAAHPEHAAALRQRIDKLVRAGLLTLEPEPSAELPERLGEFRLLRRLGAGGMGVVYLAEQASLGRTVALKLVRPEQRFFPGARERFRREVEAIARLGDPGIVPIYSVGEAEGIHFFTMEHVRGASLADALVALHDRHPADLVGADLAATAAARAELPLPNPLPETFTGTWVQACCRVVARMARAVQHAHERGVVHRDLKPSNAMVTPDGRVLLLDFGLAAAEGTLRITRTGAQLGTLHYMASEQLQDGVVGPRTDVYALGVTLHELLALEPPFHEASSERLRAAILAGTPRPIAGRGAEVPRDVETICRRAMACEPERRYPSASDLAQDLDRFLSHRPILARPAGPWLRLSRWVRRRPTAATALAIAVVAAAAVPFAMQLARVDAETSARANLRNAAAAIDRMLTQVRDPALQNAPGLDRVRLQQLDAAERLLGDLYRQNQGERDVQVLYVRGAIQAAQVRQACGAHERVLQDLTAIDPLLHRLRHETPIQPELLVDQCALWLTLGSACAGLGRIPEAVDHWQRLVAETAAVDLATAHPRVALALATAHNNLSRVLAANGDRQGALNALQRALEIEPEPSAVAGSSTDLAIDRARMRMNRAALLRDDGQLEAAAAEYQELASALAELAQAAPDEPNLRLELARVRFARSELAARRQQHDVAAAECEPALATLRELAAAYPDRTAYRRDLGVMLFQASVSRQLAGAREPAEALAREAIQSHERLLAAVPDAAESRGELTTFRRQLAGLRLAAGSAAEAVALLEQAIAEQAEVAAARPADPYYRMDLAALQQELGIHHWKGERWAPARDAWRAAASSYEQALAAGRKDVLAPRRLPLVLQVLAQAELMSDDFDGVVAALTRLQAAAPLPAASLRNVGVELHVAERDDFQALVTATEAQERTRSAAGK